MPACSYLAITYSTSEVSGERVIEAVWQWNEVAPTPYHLRSPEQIAAFFEGLELIEPRTGAVSPVVAGSWNGADSVRQMGTTTAGSAGSKAVCGLVGKLREGREVVNTGTAGTGTAGRVRKNRAAVAGLVGGDWFRSAVPRKRMRNSCGARTNPAVPATLIHPARPHGAVRRARHRSLLWLGLTLR